MPCLETNQEQKRESAPYQTTCLKVTTDSVQSSLEPASQTCLQADATNHEEIDGQTKLKIESGTNTEKDLENSTDDIITIASSMDEERESAHAHYNKTK